MKYTSPLNEITDLAGVRVILFFPDDIKVICEFIEKNFSVKERLDVGEARYSASGIFGYQSIHYLIRLQEERVRLPDFKQFADMICEIQVRTVLQHAWAEMEHDIQYKSPDSLPTEIKRKFTALAGMLEIADREFQSIQYEDQRLRKTIKKSLEEQLTREGIAETLQETKSTSAVIPEPKSLSARQLVIQGNFDKAVDAYSKQIETQPTAHTLYLGRAKARFLAGDREGALADIEKARVYKPEDPAIKITLEQIASGNVIKGVLDSDRSSTFMKMGHEALCKGDGEAAFEYYSEAQNSGYNYIFSIFNMSMACVLASDTEGARRFAGEIKPPNGAPMAVNHLALVCIIHCLEEKSENPKWPLEDLKKQMSLVNNFSYKMSPLRNLEAGFRARGTLSNGIQAVIDTLAGEEKPIVKGDMS